MSKKKDTPVSANYLAVAKPRPNDGTIRVEAVPPATHSNAAPPPPNPQTHFTNAVPLHQEPVVANGPFTTTGENISGSTTIGDLYPLPDWQKDLIGPNPGEWQRGGTLPKDNWLPGWPTTAPNTVPTTPFPPCVPQIPAITFYSQPDYWGVARKLPGALGIEFSVISPEAVKEGTYLIVARCDTREDARRICDLLIKDSMPASEPVTEVKRDTRIHYEDVQGMVKQLAGKVLTIIDASFIHESQNKAVKSLVKREFRDLLTRLFRVIHDGYPDHSGDDNVSLDD